ncbi:MAG: AMP-binding protein [Gammaproteobacteria bacterium]|nr:AMP-binding protein [Gammaproteobacteria bacterium]
MDSNKIWFEQYTHGVPETINPDEFNTLGDLFEKYADDFADRPVFTSFGTSITYSQMKVLVRDFAAFLQQTLKLKKGDRFAIMMPNILQYPIAIFGALKAGLIVVNVNPLYTGREITSQINDCGAETILVLENFADHLEAALPKTTLKNIIIAKIGDLLGCFKGPSFNIAVRYFKKQIPQYHLPNAIFFKKAMATGKKLNFANVAIKNSEMAFLQYTGGTTGVSKGAMLSHRNVIANILQCVTWIHDAKEQYFGVMIGALPMYHIFSLTVCGMCIFPMGASTLLIANPRDMSAFIKAIRHCKMTIMVGLNTLFNGLLNNAEFQTVDFSRLKLTIAGGMAMQKAVADRWQKVTNVPVLQGYGLTEASPVITLCPITQSHFTGTIGVPIPSTDVVIRDENNHDLPLGQKGEIWARGPQVMMGYWHNEAETNNVIDKNGWLRTGDIATMDDKGFVYIVDRKKDMVLISGFNVYPNEVEEVIASHPGVQTVAVIGIPNDKTGEALKAFIVKKDPTLTKEALITFCRQSLTNYKIPHFIEFRDELPLSAVGKVLRRTLRDEELAALPT